MQQRCPDRVAALSAMGPGAAARRPKVAPGYARRPRGTRTPSVPAAVLDSSPGGAGAPHRPIAAQPPATRCGRDFVSHAATPPQNTPNRRQLRPAAPRERHAARATFPSASNDGQANVVPYDPSVSIDHDVAGSVAMKLYLAQLVADRQIGHGSGDSADRSGRSRGTRRRPRDRPRPKRSAASAGARRGPRCRS